MSTTASHIGLECEPSHLVVVLNPSLSDQQWGDVDAVTQKVVSEILVRSTPTCLIDLSQLTYMGSSMVALVVRVWKSVKERNGRMAVICADDFVLGVLRVAGLDKLWTIVPDRLTAFRQLKIRGQSAPATALATPLMGSAAPAPSFDVNGHEYSGSGWGLVIAAGIGLALTVATISASSQLQLAPRAKLGLVIVCSCMGVICGAVAALNRRGLPQVMAGLCAALALGLGVASVVAKETTWKGIREIGSSSAAAGQEDVTAEAAATGKAAAEAQAANDPDRRARRQEDRKVEDPVPEP